MYNISIICYLWFFLQRLDGLCIRKGKELEMKHCFFRSLRSRRGMELVQVAILVAIAVALGLIFKTQITDFVNRTFEGLSNF